ncbi:MAG: hypothetical protein C4K49_10740 [Candidatus Thorarchaeota archaeon]|nr:MAG: hypothetical protein C4K49_10740 [Candidatus Thorarchaeota archaeon]
MIQDFGVDERELYKTWIAYIHGLAHKVKSPDVLRAMRESSQIDPRTLDYFTMMGMDLFMESISKEVARREHADQPQ